MQLETVHCYRALHDAETAGALTGEQYYELMKGAGYGEEVAQKAGTRRAADRQRNDLPP